MFDFFHKHKNNTVTKINPQVNLNPQTNTNPQQQYVQSNFQTQSTGQSIIQNQANFQTAGRVADTNSTIIQASNQNNSQAQSNNQKVVVNPSPVVQASTQTVVADPSTFVKAFTDEEIEMAEMINNLVVAILGYTPADIPEQSREQVVKECVKIFSNYMIKFVELKYGVQDSTRLKASQKFEDGSVFIKFAELGPKFEDAYNSFLETLDKRWDKVAASI
jgi:hypothetical protein